MAIILPIPVSESDICSAVHMDIIYGLLFSQWNRDIYNELRT